MDQENQQKDKDADCNAKPEVHTRRASHKENQNQDWESWGKGLIQQLAVESFKEQRRARRWKIFFRLILVVYIGIFLIMFPSCSQTEHEDLLLNKNSSHTAIIDIQGVIAEGMEASADRIIPALREAFENKNSVAIVLKINSPGGSPVQSGYVYDEIIRLKHQYPDKKIYSLITEQCTSGAYYIASATDMIYANRASLVGSIGVRMGGFGYTEAMKKIGVERRVIASGENKLFMDPYSEHTEEAESHAQKLVQEIHQQFVESVKKGRGVRLKETPSLFSGLVWTGTDSVELGLIDGLADIRRLCEEVIRQPARADYTRRGNWLEQMVGQLAIISQASIKWGGSALD
jgi:protease-4